MLSVNSKINRAFELFRQLNKEYEAWKESKPYLTLTKCNEDRTQFEVRVRFTSEPEGLRWSLIAGEVLFNLRCALDHLVYLLAVTDSGLDPPADADKLMFPITTSDTSFQSALRKGLLKGLSDMHKDHVSSHQPYARSSPPENSPLFALQFLNNVDKHRYLHMSVFSLVKARADLKGFPPGVTKVSFNEEPLRREDWVISFQTSGPCAGPEGELNFSLRLGFLEERYRKRQLLEVLKECIDAVIDVARPFQPNPSVGPTPASGRT